MRLYVVLIAALIGGFLIGILLSEVIGIAGMLFWGQALGIKYLPVFTALACAAVALVVERLARRTPR